MKFPSALSAALFLFAAICPLHGQEGLSDADKALFDELQVTEEAEKAARRRLEKSETPPQPELSAAAAKILDRLQVFEASINGITDEAIALSRKDLTAQLLKLSGTTAEPAKTELIAAAKNIEGLAPGTELLAGTEGDFPGEWIYNAGDKRWFYRDGNIKVSWSTGKWRWLNEDNRVVVADYAANEYVDLMRLAARPGKPPSIEVFNQNASRGTFSKGQSEPSKPALPAEAGKLITAARAHESQARASSLRQTGEKRERVAAWLVEKAKTDPPAAAKILIENANNLRAGTKALATTTSRRNPDAFRGKIYVDQKQRSWEFLPDGKVKSKGLSWGFWEWAKANNDACIVIFSGAPGKAENPMLVRQSGTSPGTMRFIGFDEKFDAKLKP